jgi:zinc and cadmium transporter
VLVGDSIHNFCDGVLIAAAFLADAQSGLVDRRRHGIAHEIPQEVGDYLVLLNAGFSRARALAYNALSGLGSGGGRGARLLALIQPFEIAAALSDGDRRVSSFIYVAVADLIPQLQRRLPWRATLVQVAWIGAGLALMSLASLGHAH